MKTTTKGNWISKLNAWLHLWLGLSSAIVVFIVALTGTIFVFCDDVIDGLAGSNRYTEVRHAQKLSPEELLTAFKKQQPGRKPLYFTFYREESRTVKLASMDRQKKLSYSWMDPYSGKVLTTGTAYYFFYVIAHIHSGEMPFGKTGNMIVQVSTWIFLIELITGLILWWPKKWTLATRRQSFSIKWKAGFKRVNYDLHNVPGFYSLIPALLITTTGLVIVNRSLNKITHVALHGNANAYEHVRKLAPAYDSSKTLIPLKEIAASLITSSTEVKQIRLQVPAGDSATSLYAATAEVIGLKGMKNGRSIFVDRYTGRPIIVPKNIEKGLAIDGSVMNLHIGFWWGWWGKVITALAGFVCMSLSVTGFLIWWGRRKKQKIKTTSTKLKLTEA